MSHNRGAPARQPPIEHRRKRPLSSVSFHLCTVLRRVNKNRTTTCPRPVELPRIACIGASNGPSLRSPAAAPSTRPARGSESHHPSHTRLLIYGSRATSADHDECAGTSHNRAGRWRAGGKLGGCSWDSGEAGLGEVLGVAVAHDESLDVAEPGLTRSIYLYFTKIHDRERTISLGSAPIADLMSFRRASKGVNGQAGCRRNDCMDPEIPTKYGNYFSIFIINSRNLLFFFNFLT